MDDLLEATRRPGPGPIGVEPLPAILLCSDLARDGLDLDELKRTLASRLPELEVTLVDQLCERPAAAAAALRATGRSRAVVGTCRRAVAEAELRARARRSGSTLHDIAIVRVPRTRGSAVAAAVVEAALARLARTPSGEPARAVPTPNGLSRRALLQLLSAVTMEPVAAVDPSWCTGFDRCGLCAPACPVAAIAPRDGKAAIRGAACDACGLCVPACPAHAIHLAGASTSAIEAQLATLLQQHGSAGIVFACTRARAQRDDDASLDDWAVVELPSLSIVTPGWILQLLASGAAGVRLSPCDGACCAPWREGGASLDLCRRLLPRDLAGRVFTGQPGSELPPPTPRLASRLTLAEPRATADGLRRLEADLELDHPASPLGVIEVDDGCTVCGACTTTCPTAALALVEDDDSTTLRFDPSRCTGCGLCAGVCPEHVIRVERRIDTARLTGESIPLACTSKTCCARCGDPLPPRPVLERNRRLLAEAFPILADSWPDLCFACARAGSGSVDGDTISRPRPEPVHGRA